jgi:hypothetical protein
VWHPTGLLKPACNFAVLIARWIACRDYLFFQYSNNLLWGLNQPNPIHAKPYNAVTHQFQNRTDSTANTIESRNEYKEKFFIQCQKSRGNQTGTFVQKGAFLANGLP